MDEIRIQNTPAAMPVGAEQLKKLVQILQKYKAGKTMTERRIVASENWWKLRNGSEEPIERVQDGYTSRSGWLHNVITSKHADAMDAYPEPVILPREPDDRRDARMLSSIIPCVMEQNDFEQTYSDVAWQKLKTGTGAYKVVWDSKKLNGLGDISISRVNLLNLFWEPGVTDIQKSRYFFHTELVDREVLVEAHPELEDKLKSNTFISTKFLYDDTVSTEDKLTVIDCYYHRLRDGKSVLHYVKFVNDSVLYASENDPELAERGFYDHGMYPYVFDALFPIEGSPCGYGFVDLCRSPQTTIDALNTTFVRSAMVSATPRFFTRTDGAINEEELLDTNKPLIHVQGTLGEDSIRQLNVNSMDGIYVNFLDRVIDELRQTSGNTETATGSTSSGVTAASAIAALQEASGKGSRDATASAYRAYAEIVRFVIELIRQFYDLPRQFRIMGQYGTEQFVEYSNEGIRPQAQGMVFGVDMGMRLPEFDIKVSAQKRSAYTRIAQNELALQFYQLGFFNPQMTDQALACLDMMEFDGKDELMQKIAQNGSMFQLLTNYMQLSLRLARKAAPDMVNGISQSIMQTLGAQPQTGGEPIELEDGEREEQTRMKNAREKANAVSQPGGAGANG